MKSIMKQGHIKKLTVMLGLMSVFAVPVNAQTLSDWLADQVQEQMQSRFEVGFHYQAFELNTLTAELSASQIRFETDIPELPATLNQLASADELLLQGDWQLPAQGAAAPAAEGSVNNLRIDYAELRNVQLTVAYFAPGRSNLHVLLEQAKAIQLQRTNAAERLPMDWSLEEVVLRQVELNLFDDGMPLASIRIPKLVLPAVNSRQSTDEQVDALLWPILKQLGEQAMHGSTQDVQVDTQRLMKFLWREM